MFSHIIATHIWWITTCIVATLTFVAGGYTFRALQKKDLHKRQLLALMKDKLQKLEDQIPGHSGWAEHLCKGVGEGNYTFAELGTTKEKLERLGYLLDHKERCLNCVGYLRIGGCSDWKLTMDNLQKYLKEAELTLEDIGSNQQEFDGFPKHNTATMIRFYLGRIRSNYPLVQNAIEWIHALEQQKLVALSEFDLSAEEKKLLAH
ncbi:MAG: hypothetical protein Q7R93_04515 [bacterium]|nr:hypothetical protein [bacterium]